MEIVTGAWSVYADRDTCSEVLEQADEQICECPDCNEAIPEQ